MKRILLLLLIFLAACNSTSNGNGSVDIDVDVYTGTEGVELVYDEDNFEKSLTQGQTFYYQVLLQNIGSYDADGLIVVSFEQGILATEGGGSAYSEPFTIPGKTTEDMSDKYDTITFPAVVGILDESDFDENTDARRTVIRTNLCYNYHGKMFTGVCLDLDTLDTNDQGICDGSDVDSNLGSGQGGPVVISRVDTKVVPFGNQLRPKFTIYVENSGRGEVFKRGAHERVCKGAGIQEDDLNTVTWTDITFSRFGRGDFDCTPEYIDVTSERNFFTCMLKEGRTLTQSESFKSVLTFEIDYGYKIKDPGSPRAVYIEKY